MTRPRLTIRLANIHFVPPKTFLRYKMGNKTHLVPFKTFSRYILLKTRINPAARDEKKVDDRNSRPPLLYIV